MTNKLVNETVRTKVPLKVFRVLNNLMESYCVYRICVGAGEKKRKGSNKALAKFQIILSFY